MLPYRKIFGAKQGKIFWRFSDLAFYDLNPKYEQIFHREVFGLRVTVGLTLDEIENMPIQERRLYILLWNEKIERENRDMKNDWGDNNSNMADIQDMVSKAHPNDNVE